MVDALSTLNKHYYCYYFPLDILDKLKQIFDDFTAILKPER